MQSVANVQSFVASGVSSDAIRFAQAAARLRVGASADGAAAVPPASASLGVAGAQREVDEAAASVRQFLDAGGAAESRRRGFTVLNTSPAVERIALRDVRLRRGEEVDINVDITASAQQAGLLLSFGGQALDFAFGSTFTLNLEGSRGRTTLAFASGNTLAAVVAEVNSLSRETGILAEIGENGTSIRVVSRGFGSDEFVSVGSNGEAVLAGTSIGIYTFENDDFNTVNEIIAGTFQFPRALRDNGQDVQGIINGVQANGRGQTLTARLAAFRVALRLDVGDPPEGASVNAQNLGRFTAAKVVGTRNGAGLYAADGTLRADAVDAASEPGLSVRT